jgi:hypothetical protein
MNTITTYIFSELPTQELKDKAIENHRDTNMDYHGWHECTIDDWKEKLESLGYSDPEIQYSGFWSQGDGASFTSKQVPLPSTDPDVIEAWDQLTGAAALIGVNITEEISDLAYGKVYRSSHRYSHENTVSVDWEWNDPPFQNIILPEGIAPFVEALHTAVEAYFDGLTETVRDLCREIYDSLEKEYEYQTSDEAVAESLISNEHEFEVDEEGELV